MRLHEFYKKFEELPRDERFELISYESQPTSFFVIFQQLSEVRKQIKYFETREEHLLKQAEEAFKRIK